jgi:hypothetical protein
MFETETEAKAFARTKLDDGLIVYAGTVAPSPSRRLVPSTCVLAWVEGPQEPEKPNGSQEHEK